jgi:hypothetical protein
MDIGNIKEDKVAVVGAAFNWENQPWESALGVNVGGWQITV